jgi:arylsulfatase A-like enzyme
MKNRLNFILLLILLAGTALGSEHPNLIVILADDMGIGDIGAFRELFEGGPEDHPNPSDPNYPGELPIQLAYRFTPNLDRLAHEGIRATRTYATAWCAPSRQMLLSGQWSSRRDAYDYPWIGKQLRDAGYVTCMIGKSHGRNPTQRAFRNTDHQTAEFDDGLFLNLGARDFYMQAGETLPGRIGLEPFEFTAKDGDYITDVLTDHAVDFIERNADRPFMLYLAYTAPHEPLHGKPEDLKKLFPDVFGHRSAESIIAEVDGNRFRQVSDELKAYHYAAMVYNMDLGIGRIMDVLKKHDIDRNTLVIFTCDNGAQWGTNYPWSGHKTETRDGGIRVPLIAWYNEFKQSGSAGSVYNGLLSLADIAPTFADLAGIESYPFPTDGTSMMPYWTGRKKPPTGRTFFWSNASRGGSLRDKVDGVYDFWDKPLPEALIQVVYVKDEEKITLWNPHGSDQFGAVYNKLPDVVGKANPAAYVMEHPPVAGQVPVEGPGRKLYDEMIELIRSSDNGITPTWSGCPTVDDYSWWFMD